MPLTPLNYPHFDTYAKMNNITHLEVWENSDTDYNFPLKNGKYILAYCSSEGIGFTEKQFRSKKDAYLYIINHFGKLPLILS